MHILTSSQIARFGLWFVSLLISTNAISIGSAQEKSVRPGINDPFQKPTPTEFLEKFEIESREVFAKREAIVQACEFQSNSTVADIGAGTGLFSRLIAKRLGSTGQVIAVDIAKEFLDHIRSTCKEIGVQNVATQVCDQDSCSLTPNSVDAAFICDTYHHFEFPEKTMLSIRSAIKPNGKLIVIDFERDPATSTKWVLDHIRANKATVIQEIEACGFQLEKQGAVELKDNYMLIFRRQPDQFGLEQSNAPTVASVREKVLPFIAGSEVAGVVTLVVDPSKILHLDAAGMSDMENHQALSVHSIHWIASMSKPVTAACVMMLVDEGKLKLEDSIAKYLPEMAELKTKDGVSISVTIEQLLNHTSGMSEIETGKTYSDISLADASLKYSKLPVLFPPGSKWQYSQTSINTAARIVEVVSGLTFDRFVDERLCKPLGMKDTAFYLTDAQEKRLAKSYKREVDGALVVAPIRLLEGKRPTDRNRLPAANGGLFSTAQDYGRFCQLLLDDGMWEGKTILKKESVERMRTPTTGDLTTGFTPGNCWGVGCCIVREPQGPTEMLSKGSFGHGGAYGTQAWIDPVRKRAYILMVQRANFQNSDNSELRKEFQRVASEIGDLR